MRLWVIRKRKSCVMGSITGIRWILCSINLEIAMDKLFQEKYQRKYSILFYFSNLLVFWTQSNDIRFQLLIMSIIFLLRIFFPVQNRRHFECINCMLKHDDISCFLFSYRWNNHSCILIRHVLLLFAYPFWIISSDEHINEITNCN